MSVSIANTTVNVSGKTVVLAERDHTVTGSWTFDRDPSAPFTVTSGSAVVTNLDADKLDGLEGAAYGTRTGVETFTNKTLTSPVITTPTITSPVLSGAVLDFTGGRLTLTTAVPVTSTDVTAATTLYYTPHIHNVLSLYNTTNSVWDHLVFTELSIAVPAVATQMYDVFVYNNAGTPTLELLAWTNDTTRATALVRQDGRLCKTGVLSRRYVGSFRTLASGQTEDSYANRLVFNAYNQRTRPARKLTSGTWNYTTATYRQANNSTANQVAVVVGIAENAIDLTFVMYASNTSANIRRFSAIGEDSTTTPATGAIGFVSSGSDNAPANSNFRMDSTLKTIPAVGYHFYAMLERSEATGTCSWGDAPVLGVTLVQPGLAANWTS